MNRCVYLIDLCPRPTRILPKPKIFPGKKTKKIQLITLWSDVAIKYMIILVRIYADIYSGVDPSLHHHNIFPQTIKRQDKVWNCSTMQSYPSVIKGSVWGEM